MSRTGTLKFIGLVSMLLALAEEGAMAMTNSEDVLALLKIKASLEPSPLLVNWTVSTDPCADTWYGIYGCTNETTQRVSNLQLQNSNLSGTISPYIGNMSGLVWLDMSSNRLSGPIPTSIANLVNLSYINLHSNQLTGTLLPFTSLLKLTYLKAGENSITGGIPPGFNKLTALVFFSIADNPLGGQIPDLSNMQSLLHLHFGNLGLTGPLPASLSNLTNMIHLVVSNNGLSGLLPPSLSSLPSITLIQLENNSFTGPLPASYGNLSTLVDFRATKNGLTGALHPAWLQLANLRKLDLSFNAFSGALPSNIGAMPGLIDLNVEHNEFSGTVPASLCASRVMTTLRLNDNHFSGPLPPPCFNLMNPPVQTAFFHNNNLSGVIPNLPDNSVGYTVFGNPWCSGVDPPPLCRPPPLAPAAAPTAPTDAPVSSVPGACVCPQGQLPQPLTMAVQLYANGTAPCSCTYPSQLAINLPGVSIYEVTQARLSKLAFSVAETINLLPQQVLPGGVCRAEDPRCAEKCLYPPCNGTTAELLLLPVQGQKIDNAYIRALEFRLTSNGVISWFWNKIDDEFLPYTLVYAKPAADLTVVYVDAFSPVTLAVVGTLLGVLVLLALCVVVAFGVWGFRRRSLKFAAAPWLRLRGPSFQTMRERSYLPQSPGGSARGEGSAPLRTRSSASAGSEPLDYSSLRTYSFSELSEATDGFCGSRVIGSGGFGTVYRAVFPDGSQVAVKRLSSESKQGDTEFRAEIGAIARRLVHPNLLTLLGYCCTHEDKLIVYELMEGGDLRGYLRDRKRTPAAVFNWQARLGIACDAAAGIQYLHEDVRPPVVHRDIKASNVLLDGDFRAKISDFGLAKLFPEEGATHITTRVQGTFGYLAPDYAITGQLTTKSDVYSLGVVFLELFAGIVAVGGALAVDVEFDGSLLCWALQNNNRRGFADELMDPALIGDCPPKASKLFAALAMGMCSHDAENRPTMSQVMYTLELVQKETAASPISRKILQSLATPGSTLAPANTDVSTDPGSGEASSFPFLRKEGKRTYRPFEISVDSAEWTRGSISGRSGSGGSGSGPQPATGELRVSETSGSGGGDASRSGGLEGPGNWTRNNAEELMHSTIMGRRSMLTATDMEPEYFGGTGR